MNIPRSSFVSRASNWPACWLALELWDRLDLDTFWQPLLPDSQKGTPWLKVLKILVAYRLLCPGSEWKLHTSWFDRSAMADLLHDDFRLAVIDTLYRCHDLLLDHREALFSQSAMRRKKLKAYLARLKELRQRAKLTRDELLLAIGAAKEKTGCNAHRLVILHLPANAEQVTAETFRIELDRDKLKATRRHEGQ